MNELDLRLADIIGARFVQAPVGDSDDLLWSRIASAYLRQRARRRYSRGAGIAAVVVGLIGIASVFNASRLSRLSSPGIDWRARSEALELQLDSLNATADADADNTVVVSLRSSLSRLDNNLQTAYDHGASDNELAPLWRQRSQLLNNLLLARQGRLSQI